jgi:NDP-sugar pyrophosphorylase family protein
MNDKNSYPPIFILTGGLGTRLGALTKNKPKALVEVAGKPFVAHQLNLLRRRGANRIVLCTGFLGELIEEYVKDGSAFDLKVSYSHDGSQLLGTGGAIKHALEKFPDLTEFALTYGDSYLDFDWLPAYERFSRSSKAGLMTVLHNRNRWGRSNIALLGDLITAYAKEPSPEQFEYIDYGFSFLKARAFKHVEKAAFDLALLWQLLIANKELLAHEVDKRFYEVGSPEGIAETEAQLRKDDNRT